MKKIKSCFSVVDAHVSPVFAWTVKTGKVSFQTEDPILHRPSGMDDVRDFILVPISEEGSRVLKDLVLMPPILKRFAIKFAVDLIENRHAIICSYSDLFEMGSFVSKETTEDDH